MKNAVSLSGSVEDLPLLEILQVVSFCQKTGHLTVRAAEGDAAVVFDSGRVVAGYAWDVPALPLADPAPGPARERLVRERIAATLERLVRLREGEFAFHLSQEVPTALGGRDLAGEMLAGGINPEELMLDLAKKLDEDRRDAAAALEASFATPLAEADLLLEELALDEPAVEPPPAEAPPADGPALLLVDDEPEVCRIVGERLRAAGFGVVLAGDLLGARAAMERPRRPAAPVPNGRRRRAALGSGSLVPWRSRRRPLRDGARDAAARPADGRDHRREAAHPRQAGRGVAPGLEARPVEARPAAVRGGPARVRREAGQGPAAAARGPPRRDAPVGWAPARPAARPAAPPRRRRPGARRRARRGARGAARPPRSRHGGLPAAAHGAQLLPARGAVPGARRAAARPRGRRARWRTARASICSPASYRCRSDRRRPSPRPSPSGARGPGRCRPTVRCARWSTAWATSEPSGRPCCPCGRSTRRSRCVYGDAPGGAPLPDLSSLIDFTEQAGRALDQALLARRAPTELAC